MVTYPEYFDPSFRLCFVNDGIAWFADCDPTLLWGDDWDDAPYESNASEPSYRRDRSAVEFRTLAFRSELITPGEKNEWCSAEFINQGEVPWLSEFNSSTRKQGVYAGASMEEFATAVKAAEGTVYVPLND